MSGIEDFEGFRNFFVNVWDILRNESEGSLIEQGLRQLIHLCDSMSSSPNNNTAFIRFLANELKDENYATILLVILKSLRQLAVFREGQRIINSMIVVLKTMPCNVAGYHNQMLQVP
jgi:hypothetical protein